MFSVLHHALRGFSLGTLVFPFREKLTCSNSYLVWNMAHWHPLCTLYTLSLKSFYLSISVDVPKSLENFREIHVLFVIFNYNMLFQTTP